jgi:hypothetical protein
MAWSARKLAVDPGFWMIPRVAGSILVPKCARALIRNLIGETQVPLRLWQMHPLLEASAHCRKSVVGLH